MTKVNHGMIRVCILRNLLRSSRPELLCGKGVLKNFIKFTGKHRFLQNTSDGCFWLLSFFTKSSNQNMEIWHDDVVKFRTCRSLSILEKIENPEFEPKVCEINVVLNFQKFLKVSKNLSEFSREEESKFSNIQKQSPKVFYKKRCSQKFGKIQRKTPVPESQICNFI